MKNKQLIMGMGIGIVIGGLIGFLIPKYSESSSGAIDLKLSKISELSDEYLAKVEDFGVPVEDFTINFEQVQKTLPPEQLAQLKQNEGAFKAEILETLINQIAVSVQAEKEGFLENPKVASMYKLLHQQLLFNLYVTENLPTDKSTFAPNKAELDNAFRQYRDQLVARGLNSAQSREFLIAQLSQQKQQIWMLEFIRKIREQYRIERNQKIIDAQGITAIQQNQAIQ